MEWKKAVKLVLILIGIYVGFRFVLPWLLPFLLAVAIVSLIRKWLVISDRWLHLKHPAALLLFVIGILTALFFILWQLLSSISEQSSRFVHYCQECLPRWQTGMEDMLCECDQMFGLPRGTLTGILMDKLSGLIAQFRDFLAQRLSEQLIQALSACMGFFIVIAIAALAALLLYQDYDAIYGELCRQKWYPALMRIGHYVSASGIAYLRTQGIILLCIVGYNAVGLYLLGYQDTLFLGILIGIIDFLPVLGAGTVLLPWMFLLFLQKNVLQAMGIAVIYLLCFLTRQYLEPKLMGQQSGIRPFYSLFFIYMGLQLFGFWGIFLGPFGAALASGIYQEWK